MRVFVTVFMILGAIGCGAPQPGLKNAPVKISGKVSQAGQPVGSIAVSFHPLDHGHLTSLQVKPDGTFQGELISGTYAYSIAHSTATDSARTLPKVAPQYFEPDFQRTVKVESGQDVLIVLD